MSGDPFANTTTVKNILQNIISPKLVNDGSGGYVSRTDLVNVHNLVFGNGAPNEDGGSANPFTTQCGVAMSNGSDSIVVNHSRVTQNSIILIQNLTDSDSTNVLSVFPGDKVFTIRLNSESNGAVFGWFIAKF